jgi:FMN-dependent NADH-azoreductase
VPAGSPADFFTPYLRHIFGFVGISDLEFVTADRVVVEPEKSLERARSAILELAARTRAKMLKKNWQ